MQVHAEASDLRQGPREAREARALGRDESSGFRVLGLGL